MASTRSPTWRLSESAIGSVGSFAEPTSIWRSARSIRSKPTQMMINGAMATTGVTCRTTA